MNILCMQGTHIIKHDSAWLILYQSAVSIPGDGRLRYSLNRTLQYHSRVDNSCQVTILPPIHEIRVTNCRWHCINLKKNSVNNSNNSIPRKSAQINIQATASYIQIKFDPYCLHWSCSPSTVDAAGKRPCGLRRNQSNGRNSNSIVVKLTAPSILSPYTRSRSDIWSAALY